MLLISLIIIPTNVFAYSNKIIVGGQNIGIEVKTKGILVIGLYKINNELIAESSGLKPGDYITKVNNRVINNISDFTNEINNDKSSFNNAFISIYIFIILFENINYKQKSEYQ